MPAKRKHVWEGYLLLQENNKVIEEITTNTGGYTARKENETGILFYRILLRRLISNSYHFLRCIDKQFDITEELFTI